MKKFLSIFACLTLPLLAQDAEASLIGDEVFLSCTHDDGPFDNCEGRSPQGAIVGAGPEFDVFGNGTTFLDVGDSSIALGFNGPFCGWFACSGSAYIHFLLEDLNWVDMPTAQIVDIIVNHTFLPGSVVSSFGPHSVEFGIREQSLNQNTSIQIDLVTRPIPEPSTVLLFGLGFVGLTLLGFRRLH